MKETAEITVDSVESSDRLSDDLCPFIKFPGSDCYCLNIDSEHIGCMDDFCIGHIWNVRCSERICRTVAGRSVCHDGTD